MRNLLLVLIAATTVLARDPNYAVEVDVPSQDVTDRFRVVALGWFTYLGDESSTDKQVYVRIASLPKTVKVITRVQTSDRARVLRYTQNENAKRRLVRSAFDAVFGFYTQKLFGSKRVQISHEQVDRQPVFVQTPTGPRRFNRTIVISFEDPPYGQSMVNRLVTNRNIPWVVWAGIDTEPLRLSSSAYNQTQDLLYRYLHNVGHLLGYGHYVESRNRDGRDITQRSVMYANYHDKRYSATRPVTGLVDLRAMPQIAQRPEALLREHVRSRLEYRVVPAIVNLFEHAALLARFEA